MKKHDSIDQIIRVNHAGEYGAKRIYLGQLSVFQDDLVIKEMYNQEVEHLQYFENQLRERGIRPTLLSPFWHFIGYKLGKISARISRDAAMACTEAVEEVIDAHYQEQLAYLVNKPQYSEIAQNIEKFRDDEIHHKITAIDEGAHDAIAYKAFSTIIKGITKIAISLSKKI